MFFPVPTCLEAGAVAFEPRVCPSLAILPCRRSSFLEQGKLDRGGRSSLVWEMVEPRKFCVRQEPRPRKECSFHGCIKASAHVPGHFSAKLRLKKRVARSVVDPTHLRLAPRGGGSCLSAGPAVVGTPQDPCGHSQTPLVANFIIIK